MSGAHIEHTTVNMGPSDRVVDAATALAQAITKNAEAIIAIAQALKNDGPSYGVFVEGDTIHHAHNTTNYHANSLEEH